jgi:hypothetical protein
MTTGTTVVCQIYASTYANIATRSSIISVAVSGATTIVAADAAGANGGGSVNLTAVFSNYFDHCGSIVFTGLTPGVNTFTMKYRQSGTSTTVLFGRRCMVVQRID